MGIKKDVMIMFAIFGIPFVCSVGMWTLLDPLTFGERLVSSAWCVVVMLVVVYILYNVFKGIEWS